MTETSRLPGDETLASYLHNRARKADTMLTNDIAANLLNEALSVKNVITIPCPNGDTLTVCKHIVTRWGNSQFAEPGGKNIPFLGNPGNVAVYHCGRGNVAKVAREILA